MGQTQRQGGTWQPRSTLDASRLAAIARQELDNHGRPVWLPDELQMPSPTVWVHLTEGSIEKRPHELFQSVITGLVNAGWPEICVKRALRDYDTHPATPGYWWRKRRGSSVTEFARSFEKATARVRAQPPSPSLARGPNSFSHEGVLRRLGQLEQCILLADVLDAHSVLPPDSLGPVARMIALALAEHGRLHAGALAHQDPSEPLRLTASARSVGLIANVTHQSASEGLRSLSRATPSYVPLLGVIAGSRRGDATTYAIADARLRSGAEARSARASLLLPQPSPEGHGNRSNVLLTTPSWAIIAHDAFRTQGQLPGFTSTAGYLLGLIAANDGRLSSGSLALCSGVSAPAVRKSLRALSGSGATSMPFVQRGPRGAYEIAFYSEGAITDALDHMLLDRGIGSRSLQLADRFAQERTLFRSLGT